MTAPNWATATYPITTTCTFCGNTHHRPRRRRARHRHHRARPRLHPEPQPHPPTTPEQRRSVTAPTLEGVWSLALTLWISEAT